MGERKVLNKYYSPDFHRTKLPKLKLPDRRQYVVRLMAPFTMRCTTCGNYVYKGTKFNARKETVLNEKYLGLPIFRFYIRCPQCLSEITFKTDPKNADYKVDHGAYRTLPTETIAQEEANNPMLALEIRTKESRREMDILDALEEIKDVNAQHEKVSFQQLLERHMEREEENAEEEAAADDLLTKAAFETVRGSMKRLKDDPSDEEDATEQLPSRKKVHAPSQPSSSSSRSKLQSLVKKKPYEA